MSGSHRSDPVGFDFAFIVPWFGFLKIARPHIGRDNIYNFNLGTHGSDLLSFVLRFARDKWGWGWMGDAGIEWPLGLIVDVLVLCTYYRPYYPVNLLPLQHKHGDTLCDEIWECGNLFRRCSIFGSKSLCAEILDRIDGIYLRILFSRTNENFLIDWMGGSNDVGFI